jgi:hypothetical protein
MNKTNKDIYNDKQSRFSKLQYTCFPEEFLFASVICGSSIIVTTGRHQERCDQYCREPHVSHTTSAICNKKLIVVVLFSIHTKYNINVLFSVFNSMFWHTIRKNLIKSPYYVDLLEKIHKYKITDT